MIEIDELPDVFTNPVELRLTEQLNCHTTIELRFDVDIGLDTVLIGRELSFEITPGNFLFKGVITDSVATQRELWVMASSFSIGYGLAQRVRCFPATQDAVPFDQTLGFRDHFWWLNWEDIGCHECACLFQYYESDWEFARRMATTAGSCLIPSATNRLVRLMDEPTEIHEIGSSDAEDNSTTVSQSLKDIQGRVDGWDLTSAERHVADSDLTPLSSTEESINHAFGDLVQGGPGAISQSEYVFEESRVASSAAVHSMFRRGAVQRWRTTLSHKPEVSIGHQINLSDELGGDSVRVWRRVLTLVNGRFVNTIDCGSLASAPPNSLELIEKDRPAIEFGVVLGIADDSTQGRVNVQLSFQDDGGVWCVAPQPFAGDQVAACVLPSPGDQVAILIEPRGNGFPIVLGAMFHAGAPVPDAINEPGTQKMLFYTSQQQILGDAQTNEILIRSGGANIRVANNQVSVTGEQG